MEDDPISQLLALDPTAFEGIIVKALEAQGFVVEHTGKTGDGGIDALAHSTDPFISGTYIIQCKRFDPANKVDVATVRDLYGVVTDRRAAKGIIVTTWSFTLRATQFAHGKNLELMDGERLATLLRASGLLAELPRQKAHVLSPSMQAAADLMSRARTMGEGEAARFLAHYGWTLAINGNEWSMTRADSDRDQIPDEADSVLPKLIEGVTALMRGHGMIAAVKLQRVESGKLQAVFAVSESFGGVLKCEDSSAETTSSDEQIAGIRRLMRMRPASAKHFHKWLKLEDDHRGVADFARQKTVPRSAFIYATLAAWHLPAAMEYELALSFGVLAAECLAEEGADDRLVADFVYNLGLILGTGLGQAPTDLWVRCISKCPNNPLLRLDHAANLSKAPKDSAAEKEFLWQAFEAARIGADVSDVQSRAAKILALNHPQEALAYAERALKLASTSEDKHRALFALGASRCNLGRDAEAVDDLQQVVNFDPADLDARAVLAAALFNSGERQRAKCVAKECLELGSTNPMCAEIVSKVNNSEGNDALAH